MVGGMRGRKILSATITYWLLSRGSTGGSRPAY
nr:MAG TPA: hypothetical protein [Caudoviricetes sp.]